MAKYIERLKDKVKIKKFDSNQPIGAWIFVIILNIVGFAGYFYLKVNHIELGSLKIYLISFLIERQKFFSLSFLVKSGKVQIDSVSGNESLLHSLNSSIIEALFNFDVNFFRFFIYFLITVRFASIYSLIINTLTFINLSSSKFSFKEKIN